MSVAEATNSNEMVLIPLERLKALEALEADLPNMIAKAKKDRDNERFKILHERGKANPEPHRRKVLDNYHKNREEKYEITNSKADIVQITELFNIFIADTGIVMTQKIFASALKQCNINERKSDGIRYYYGIKRF